MPVSLLPELNATLSQLISGFDGITQERKEILTQLTSFVQSHTNDGKKVCLNFICTHNSRRSHLAQLWGQTAAYYYGIPDVECFSGGTEATAFNPRAVTAMRNAGFGISTVKAGENPTYEVHYSQYAPAVIAFSKKYDDPINPNKDFAAVMTCSHADENCPVVKGASARIALTYDDPKTFDGMPEESTRYTEKVNEIGREILFAFSQIKIQRS